MPEETIVKNANSLRLGDRVNHLRPGKVDLPRRGEGITGDGSRCDVGTGHAVDVGGYCLGAAHPNPNATKPIEVLRAKLQLQIASQGLSAIVGRLGKEIIPFYRKDEGAFAALVGIDLEAKPGTVKVIIKDTTDAGAHREIAIPLRIKPKAFKKECFSVAANSIV